jgi:hypothetical protein
VHRLLAAFLALTAFSSAAPAAPQHCAKAPVVLWGDGRHDDSFALNAWLRGEDAVWADSGAPVGAAIVGRSFRLSDPVYVRAGAGRRLESFRLAWPERGETVSGGTVLAGSDPDRPPATSGLSIQGGDPGEGRPFDLPDNLDAAPDPEAACATS